MLANNCLKPRKAAPTSSAQDMHLTLALKAAKLLGASLLHIVVVAIDSERNRTCR